jgi:hypothetical protein
VNEAAGYMGKLQSSTRRGCKHLRLMNRAARYAIRLHCLSAPDWSRHLLALMHRDDRKSALHGSKFTRALGAAPQNVQVNVLIGFGGALCLLHYYDSMNATAWRLADSSRSVSSGCHHESNSRFLWQSVAVSIPMVSNVSMHFHGCKLLSQYTEEIGDQTNRIHEEVTSLVYDSKVFVAGKVAAKLLLGHDSAGRDTALAESDYQSEFSLAEASFDVMIHQHM